MPNRAQMLGFLGRMVRSVAARHRVRCSTNEARCDASRTIIIRPRTGRPILRDGRTCGCSSWIAPTHALLTRNLGLAVRAVRPQAARGLMSTA